MQAPSAYGPLKALNHTEWMLAVRGGAMTAGQHEQEIHRGDGCPVSPDRCSSSDREEERLQFLFLRSSQSMDFPCVVILHIWEKTER